MQNIVLDGESLSLDSLRAFLKQHNRVSIADSARARVVRTAEYCRRVASTDGTYYGINTGFGVLARQRIAKDSLAELQRNLLRSHAVGMGEDLPADVVRLMMLLRVNSLIQGYSGVSTDVIDLLVDMINADVVPCVPAYGSVGASGDLAPLAHMALPLIGEGAVRVKGRRVAAKPALEMLARKPVELGPKEGLALINGTQLMSAYAVRESTRCRELLSVAIVAACMSLEAYEATDRMFDERIHALKPHPGEVEVAAAFRRALAGSDIVAGHKLCDRVQDPYSFRCIPQVLGAVLDTMLWVEEWVTREINSVTDNPLVFPDDGEIVSGGNFHGQHMAFALDALAIAGSEVGSIAERRIDKLLSNNTATLPDCLVGEPGLNSGLMVVQYLAAALVSENKGAAHPASVDTIPTSAGFEDHVSMGSIAALKLARVLDNVERILCAELLCGAQALDFHAPKRAGVASEAARAVIREKVPFIEKDCVISDLLSEIQIMVNRGTLLRKVEQVLGGTVLRK